MVRLLVPVVAALSLDGLLAAEIFPAVQGVVPAPGAVSALTEITVTFTKPVSGVSATDLLVGGNPAISVSGTGAIYTFALERQPAYGTVRIGWDAGHGIFDLDLVPHRFDEKAATSAWQYELVDVVAPAVSSLTPAAGVTVRQLTQIEVLFSEPVLNLEAGDLLVNGLPAGEISVRGPGRYLFKFGQPATGEVRVGWAPDHGIGDFASPANALAGATWSYQLDPGFGLPSIRINEFLASNTKGLLDEDREPEDWIELHNYGTTPVDLTGFALTDDAEDPGKWTFPAMNMEAGRYLVVFASAKDRKSPAGANRLHTNFKLNPAGEFLGLFNAESPRVALTEFTPRFPEQRNDHAYGYLNDAVPKYFSVPTPGAENGKEEISGTMPPPHFNVARGYFEAPFELILSAPIPGATIRYTTDGQEPTGSTGLEYTQPVPIAKTAIVRAASFRADRLPSITATHSYIFPDQVLRQPNKPQGFPIGSAVMAGFPSDYEMDPEIVTNAVYRDSLKQALRALPVLSIVCASNDMFGPVTGIYTHPTTRGPAWEKPCSVEFILTNGASGFQVNAGIQMQGNAARDPQKQPKHPFRLVFKGDYGAARLSYQVFPDSPVENFDTLILRADYNFSWLHWSSDQRPRGQRTRDAWMKDSMRAMGGLASHNRYVHLYLNGLYWGIYDPSERPDAAFAASYLGGEKEEYDSVNEPLTNGSQAVDGNLAAYNAMLGVSNLGDVNRYNQIKQYLDVAQFIDYMLLHFYAGHQDWGNDKNWYAVRRREPGAGFKYVPWDGENILDVDVNYNRVSDSDVPSSLHTKLLASGQYKMDFADRVQKHLLHDGALTTNAVIARWMNRAAQVDLPIIAESARWGDDYRRDVHQYSSGPYELYTRNGHWLTEQSRLLNQYFPRRTGIVLNQLRSAGLYPSLSAPLFNQQGGRVARGFNLAMSATNTIYYTTNGVDPRVYGSGAVAPEAQVYAEALPLHESATVKARAFGGNKWSALSEAIFTVGALGLPLRITEIMYNPVGGDAYEFVELQNVGTAAIDLGYYSLDGLGFVFGPRTLLPAGAVIVLGSDKSPANWAMRYPGVAVAGRFSGALANGGEKIAIKDPGGHTVYSVDYRDTGGWPVAADGSGYSLEMTDPFGDPDDPAQWRASPGVNGTPGLATLPSQSPANVLVNEVMAENVAAVRNGGIYPDWVELHNRGSQPVELAGWSLSDDGSPGKFVFPPGARVLAGGYGVVWCDNLPSSETEWHAGFSLDREGETVFLFDAGANRVDAVAFGRQLPDRSLGRVNDQWVLTSPTPLAANQPAPLAVEANLVFNEWLANSAPGGADWIELHNRSSDGPVALQGLYLGTSNTTFQITTPSFVPPGGFIQLFADEQPGADHLDFKLSASGGTILLYDETGAELDRVVYAAQAQDLSQGRYPDGTMAVTNFPSSASPGASNYLLPYQGPVLNEILANNQAAATNSLGRTAGFVELFNPNDVPFDLSGMRLSISAAEPNPWAFPTGLSLPGRSYLVVWCDDQRPASAGLDTILNTGRGLAGKGGAVQLLDRMGRVSDAIEYGFQIADLSIGRIADEWRLLGTPSPGGVNSQAHVLDSPASLRFNEWMAGPATGADWFEIYNGASQPAQLGGLYLSDDPSSAALARFEIAPLSFIGPGAWALWIADGEAAAGPDHVNFSLDEEGEALCLFSPEAGMIDAVYFGRQSAGVSQGHLPDGESGVASFSSTPTPGESNYLPVPNVEISEVLARAVAPLENAIELSNVTTSPVDAGGWYLSDSERDFRKFRIPSGTVLAAYGFTVFYENQFSGGFGSLVPFRWDGLSEGAVYLSQADAQGRLTGYRSRVRFGPAERGVSVGLYQSSVGRVFTSQSGRTFGVDDPRSLPEFRFGSGRTNSYPKVGPVVLNELMYHPPRR